MKRLAISIAHHKNAKGASYGDMNEFDVSVIISELLFTYCKLFMFDDIEAVLVPEGRLHNKVKFINDNDFDVAIEVHLNSHIDKSISGHEVLYCPDSYKGKKLADRINKALSLENYTKNRGVNEGWYRMEVGGRVDYFLARTNCPAVIIEPEFIAKLDMKDIWCVVEAIAKGVHSYERLSCKL